MGMVFVGVATGVKLPVGITAQTWVATPKASSWLLGKTVQFN